MSANSKIILALDSSYVDRCSDLIQATYESVGIYKLGLEFYLKNGAPGIDTLKSRFPELRIFLDLKLHDIPNTVAGAAASIAPLAPEIVTVHASGGAGMISAAIAALPRSKVAAVTVLTSITEAQTEAIFAKSPLDLVLSLAKEAIRAGATALVASPLELVPLRQAIGPSITLITPGIRELSAPSDDQSRTMSARDAIAAGADLLVIGRPITAAANPAAAAANFYKALL